MGKIVDFFKPLPYQRIAAERPGNWGDFELLDVLSYFNDQKDRKRAAAILTLILHSPEHSGDMLAYGELYFDLIQQKRLDDDYAAALRWAHAGLAYAEQHEPGQNRANGYRDLAEVYLYAEDFNTGLAILTRYLKTDPTDIWTYNIMGLNLPGRGLSNLAIEVLDQGLKLIARSDPENLEQQFTGLIEEARTKTANSPSRLQEIDPVVLTDLRSALKLAETAQNDEPDLDSYLPPINQLLTIDDLSENSVR